MDTKKRKWILRSVQVLIGLVLMLSVVPAGAHLSGGYLHHDKAGDWNYSNPDWMKRIPNGRPLSDISIIETHDTMAIDGGGGFVGALAETQSLDLKTQLESGIRSLDIRLQRKNGVLECWHGATFLNADFDDVLETVVAFLEANPSETILMRIAENSRPNPIPVILDSCGGFCPIGDNPPFVEMVEEYLQRTYIDQYSNPIGPYSDWVWQPTNVNPMLGEVRGKIVILDNFSPVGESVDLVADGEKLAEGQNSSLALDTTGNPHISYYSAINGELKYAFRTGDFWWFAPVDDGSGNDVGKYTSIALDDYDHPHISYYDASNGDLKYAYGKKWNGYEQGWDWEISQVDDGSGNDVGKYTSIALDNNDHPHISYYDESSGELRIANYVGNSSGDCVNNNWDCYAIDGGPGMDVGQYTSLKVDTAGNTHISYYDATNIELRYVHWNGNNWTYAVVDSVDDVGQYSSLALDDKNRPHFSYYDETNHDLKYAFWDNIKGWVKQIVDWEGEVGKYTSIALDGNNHPHISYYNAENDDIMYAYMTEDGNWSIRTVDSRQLEYQGDVGLYNSLALDANGNPHVSYFHDLWMSAYYDSREYAILLYADLTDNVCGEGVPYITNYGLRSGCEIALDYWSLCDKIEVYRRKWPRIKYMLKEANEGPFGRYYLNGLNATSGGGFLCGANCWLEGDCPFPWFVASGHVNSDTDADREETNQNCTDGNPPEEFSDFPCNDSGDKMLYEGTNELTLTYIKARPAILWTRRWGIIVMDFPGEDLIDEIISSNFPMIKSVYIPAILK